MANNISVVQTDWGKVIATVRQQLIPNETCELAPGQCSVLAYLAMSGQRDPFAGVHQHLDGLVVIHATIRSPEGIYLVTGPFAALPEAIQEAARIYAQDSGKRLDAERAQRGLPPKDTPVAEFKSQVSQEAQLDILRRKDTRDVAEYGAVHWEQQLIEILGRK
jgi:hypothetical protein